MKNINKKQHNQAKLLDHHALIITFKNSISYSLNIFKLLKIPPKQFSDHQPQTLLAYAQYLESSIKMLLDQIPKVSTSILNLQKIQKAYAEAEKSIQQLTRDSKNQYIQYKIMEQQLQNFKKQYTILQDENKKLKKIGIQLEKKVQKIQKQSTDGIQRIIQVGSEKLKKEKRKQSLPTLVNSSHKQKMSILWMMDGFSGSAKKNERYIEHLLKKY